MADVGYRDDQVDGPGTFYTYTKSFEHQIRDFAVPNSVRLINDKNGLHIVADHRLGWQFNVECGFSHCGPVRFRRVLCEPATEQHKREPETLNT